MEEHHGPDHAGQETRRRKSHRLAGRHRCRIRAREQEPERLRPSDRVRVWEIKLKPGERFGFHRHVLDYFWSVSTNGKARAHVNDGTTVEHTYIAGETRHETHEHGHYKVHDLENIGTTDLNFVTVEFLDSVNKPLPVPDNVRMKG
jgi:hypothetical protein